MIAVAAGYSLSTRNAERRGPATVAHLSRCRLGTDRGLSPEASRSGDELSLVGTHQFHLFQNMFSHGLLQLRLGGSFKVR